MIVGIGIDAADGSTLDEMAHALKEYVAKAEVLQLEPNLISAGLTRDKIGKRLKDSASAIIISLNDMPKQFSAEFPIVRAVKMTEAQSKWIAKTDIIIPPKSITEAIDGAIALAYHEHTINLKRELVKHSSTIMMELTSLVDIFVQTQGFASCNNHDPYYHMCLKAIGTKNGQLVAVLRSYARLADNFMVMSHVRSKKRTDYTICEDNVVDSLDDMMDCIGQPEEDYKNWARVFIVRNEVHTLQAYLQDDIDAVARRDLPFKKKDEVGALIDVVKDIVEQGDVSCDMHTSMT